jgi:hypothetical protein
MPQFEEGIIAVRRAMRVLFVHELDEGEAQRLRAVPAQRTRSRLRG